MASYAPITLQIVDENGNQLFSDTVPYEWEMDVRQVMERAFILSQSAATPDPFIYTLQYFGYSEAPQFPGYLGYEIESIASKANTPQFFWQLFINGAPSQQGADTEQPGPGSTVLWQYTQISKDARELSARSRVVRDRRFTRQPSRA